ncbi:hypothetical protein LPTSP4_20330 [Leptospira ryugenii]|uniref:Putative regulatory protein LPTSP4_20330 n=1 Tax=Leptospira ryugenii TaxID=1917863 RepID=A0A2P2E0U2_9LEPT|nr:extracellular matrix/biofilm biosynthesis regulator RemA family protein [Leptospira ryugenii]GBF50507.1 hypothetical protein LPTSP4_20330 [Leptospira ryugenii]
MSSFPILNVGFSNVVFQDRILVILQSESAGAKRLRSEAKDSNRLIDATQGRKTRSLLVLHTGHVVLSALRPESLTRRIEGSDNSIDVEEEDFDD